MKNFIIAVLSTILIGLIGYYCYIFYYKQETFQSDKYKLPIDNSKLVKEVFPNYKVIEKPVTERELLNKFFSDYCYPLDGSKLFEEIRNTYKHWYKKTYIKYDIRKNPEKITTFFKNHKKDFYDIVSYRNYHNSNIDKILESLLVSYDDLYKNPDLVNKNMESLFKMMNNEDPSAASENYYSDIEKIASPESLEILKNTINKNEVKFRDGDIVWFYSFWVRRYKEGNINQTIAIIREVSNHYKPDFEDSEE